MEACVTAARRRPWGGHQRVRLMDDSGTAHDLLLDRHQRFPDWQGQLPRLSSKPSRGRVAEARMPWRAAGTGGAWWQVPRIEAMFQRLPRGSRIDSHWLVECAAFCRTRTKYTMRQPHRVMYACREIPVLARYLLRQRLISILKRLSRKKLSLSLSSTATVAIIISS